MIDHEGMPTVGNPFVKGRLFILFKVKFPPTILPEEASVLERVLPGRPMPAFTGEEEE
ncbi:unnamed protein product, partial [Discosporangium mesarthrocarpum]